MDEHYGGASMSDFSDDLSTSCSSNTFQKSDLEGEEVSLGIFPYQFEPYRADARRESEVRDGEGIDDEDGRNGNVKDDAANRLSNRDW